MKRNLMNLGLWVVFVALAAGCGGNDGYKHLTGGAMPQMATWDGVYFSEAYGRMEMSDNGSGTIVGLYEGERFHGKIEGVAEGDLLNFKWTQWNEDLNGKSRQTTGHGYFRYSIKEEGTAEKARPTAYAIGEWGYLDANSGNTWECIKFPSNTPKILTMDGKKADAANTPSDPFANSGGTSSGSSSSDASDSGSGAMESSGESGLSEDVNDLF